MQIHLRTLLPGGARPRRTLERAKRAGPTGCLTPPGDSKILEPVHLRDRHLGVDKDAVLAVGALEAAGDLVQLVQAGALGVGDQELDLGEGLLEGRLDPLAQLVEPLSPGRRDQDRAGVGEARPRRAPPRRAGRPC